MGASEVEAFLSYLACRPGSCSIYPKSGFQCPFYIRKPTTQALSRLFYHRKTGYFSTAHHVCVLGEANGTDTLAVEWTTQHHPVNLRKVLPADWDELDHSDAIVKTRRNVTKYGARTGFRHNKQIILAIDAMIAFWVGKSRGTLDSITLANTKSIPI